MTDAKTNMKNKHTNVSCVACETTNVIVDETQDNIYTCDALLKKIVSSALKFYPFILPQK